MNNRKGFTLVEVILSLAILGIISISFATIISNHFLFFSKSKEISEVMFQTQKEMETMIDETKKSIRDETNLKVGDEIDVGGTMLTLKTTDNIWSSIDPANNGTKIKYFEAERTQNNKLYTTLVSIFKPKIEPQLELLSIGIKAEKNKAEVPHAYSTEGFSIIGNFENHRDAVSTYNLLINVIEWYVASEGFNMPIPDNKELQSELDNDVLEVSHYYPVFPRDYILVANETEMEPDFYEKIFPQLQSYAGRHVIFTATPGAKSGRIGKQSVSKPIFISGIPVAEILAIHLDASFINPYDNDEIVEDNPGISVKAWYDISSPYVYKSGRYQYDEAAKVLYSNSRPQLLKTEMGKPFIGQFVRFSNTNQILKIVGQGTRNKGIHIFAAVRSDTEHSNEIPFLKNGNSSITIPAGFGEDQTGEWIIVEKFINKAQSDDFEIGGPDVDIAEIAVYNSTLSDEEIEEIENYFLSKYRTSIISN